MGISGYLMVTHSRVSVVPRDLCPHISGEVSRGAFGNVTGCLSISWRAIRTADPPHFYLVSTGREGGGGGGEARKKGNASLDFRRWRKRRVLKDPVKPPIFPKPQRNSALKIQNGLLHGGSPRRRKITRAFRGSPRDFLPPHVYIRLAAGEFHLSSRSPR